MSEHPKAKIRQWEILYKYYIVDEKEGPFIVLKRKNEILPAAELINEDYFSRSIKPKLFSKALKNTPSADEREKIRLTNFKNHFLLYPFQANCKDKTPEIIKKELKEYLAEYFETQHIAIAKICGYNFKDINENDIPCILAKRPINGPLCLYFENESQSFSDSDLVINHSFSREKVIFTPEKKFILIIGIVAGIAFIHDKGNAFAYLNPKTVYLNKKFRPIICSCSFVKSQDIENDDIEEIIDLDCLTNAAFAAPEVLGEKHVYQSSDMFSIGMMIYYILSGVEPFQGQSEEIKTRNICEGIMPDFPEGISDEWKEIILECCQHDPKKRIKSTKLLEHLLDKENRDDLVSSMLSPDSNPHFTDQDIQYITKINTLLNFKPEYKDSKIIKMIEDYESLEEDVKLIIYRATKNEISSLEAIGLFYLKGEHGFRKDEGNAVFLLSKAADLGSPTAAKTVAKLYKEGTGTKKNLATALSYNKKALALFKDDEFEKEILEQRIKDLEDQMKNTEPKPDEEEEDEDYDDEEEEDVQNKEAKFKVELQKYKISIANITTGTKVEDIENVFKNYKIKDIDIEHTAGYDSANVTFETVKDKNSFCKSLKKSKSMQINNKTVSIETYKNNIKKIAKKRQKKTFFGSSAIFRKHTKKKPSPKDKKPEPKQRTFKIRLKDYTPGEGNENFEKVGEGTFSNVYKAYKKGTLYAAKVFRNEFLDYNQKKSFSREISSLAAMLQFPMVVKLIGYNYKSLINPKENHATVITEFEPNGTLAKMIELESKGESPNFWNNTLKIQTIIGIAKAMSYIHEKSIIHRDLKPDNIFFDEDFNIKIGDFGSSRKFNDQSEITMTLNVGTPSYAAPEILDDTTLKYTSSADVFSFGIILYQIVTGKTMKQIYKYKNAYTFYKKIIKEGLRPKIPDGIDENLTSLMEQCWSSSMDERPSFKLIYLTMKAIFEYEKPTTTFLPDVEVDEIREYLKKIDSYDELNSA